MLSSYVRLFIIIIIISEVSPLGTAAISGLLYKPQMIDEGDCGAIGGMKIVRGNRSTRRKPAPAPFCPPQIPHDQIRTRTNVGLGFPYFFSLSCCSNKIVLYVSHTRMRVARPSNSIFFVFLF
jgi:hypothetical protein